MWEKWSEINALKNTGSECGKNTLTEIGVGYFFFPSFIPDEQGLQNKG